MKYCHWRHDSWGHSLENRRRRKGFLTNRLSGGRRTIENTFVMLVARWRIVHAIATYTILPSLIVHNYLKLRENALHCPKELKIWRSIVKNEPIILGFFNVSKIRGSRYSDDARRLALFLAGTIVRDPQHRESPTHREQSLNLCRTWV